MPTPTVRLRQLSRELKRLREAANLTQADVVRTTGINKTSLIRLERARNKPQRRTLLTLLDAYGAQGKKRDALMKLYANADKPGMQSTYQDGLPGEYTAYIDFESDASRISIYESDVIPGLLATTAYAEALMAAGPPMDETAIQQRLDVRANRRKRLLADKPPELHVILGEAAIRYEVGGRKVMREQLQHLIELAGQPNVTLQVSPFSVGANGVALGTFTILEFEDVAPLGYVQHVVGNLFLDKDPDIKYVQDIHDHLRTIAHDPESTIRILKEVMR